MAHLYYQVHMQHTALIIISIYDMIFPTILLLGVSVIQFYFTCLLVSKILKGVGLHFVRYIEGNHCAHFKVEVIYLTF